jgi:hypothetical protein
LGRELHVDRQEELRHVATRQAAMEGFRAEYLAWKTPAGA